MSGVARGESSRRSSAETIPLLIFNRPSALFIPAILSFTGNRIYERYPCPEKRIADDNPAAAKAHKAVQQAECENGNALYNPDRTQAGEEERECALKCAPTFTLRRRHGRTNLRRTQGKDCGNGETGRRTAQRF